MKRLLLIAVFVSVVAIGAVLVIRPGILGSASAAASSPTPVGPVAVSSDVVAEGRAIPIRTASLGVLTGGAITQIAVLGEAVKTGDPLLALDARQADASLAEAQAGLAAATARRDQAAAAVDQSGSTIDATQAAVTEAHAGVDQATAGVDQAKAGVDQAKARVDEAKAARDILPDGASTAQKRQADAVVTGAQAQLDAAIAGVDSANAAVDAATAGLKQAEAQLQSAQAAKVVAQATATTAEAERVGAAAAVDVARATRDQLTVRAPFDGSVAFVAARVGEVAPPGVVLVRIAETSAWTFETTDLGAAGAARIKAGDPATVTIDDVPGVEIPGTVTQIGGYGEDRQGDVAFRVIVTPSGAVPAVIRWNTIVTVAVHPGS